MPKTEGSGTTEPPCYRCLFDKPISPSHCHPETCMMIEAWLMDEQFTWRKYYFGWTVRLELEFVNSNGTPEET